MGHFAVPTIFFGGGTPSLMPVEIFAQIMDAMATHFHIAPDAEITIEANPGTINKDKICDFMAAGVNRLSIGVQSMDDETLRFLGRRHSATTARELIATAQQLRIRTSADFIYGMPGNTADDVAKLCRDINELGLRHVSMYELSIEPNTPFGKMNLVMPSNDEMAEMYDAIARTLAIDRYEVSNYAADDTDQCRHNCNVWDGAPYIGIGAGAAGRVLIDDVWYEQRGANAEFSKMTTHARAIEKILTGMRTMRGVEMTPDVRATIDMDFATAHPQLVTIDKNRIHATTKGMLILDNLMIDLVK